MNDLTKPPISENTLLKAEFNPLIRPYLALYVAAILCSTIVGIPLALIWVCGVGQWWARRYFDKLECHLTDKTLHYRKGILIQVEKTIPLENIQDVTFLEGPILRRFNLSTLKFETAGHSAGQAHDMRLTGIIDAQSIVVAGVATGQHGQEGVILRYVFFHSVALAALVGLLVLAQAYLWPGVVP
jgi:putative membrane protein